MEDIREARKALIEATKELLQSSGDAVTQETERFFESVRPPQLIEK